MSIGYFLILCQNKCQNTSFLNLYSYARTVIYGLELILQSTSQGHSQCPKSCMFVAPVWHSELKINILYFEVAPQIKKNLPVVEPTIAVFWSTASRNWPMTRGMLCILFTSSWACRNSFLRFFCSSLIYSSCTSRNSNSCCNFYQSHTAIHYVKFKLPGQLKSILYQNIPRR